MLRAVLIGWLTIQVLALILAVAACPFYWTLSFVSFRAAVFLDCGVSSMVPWLCVLVAAVVLGFGGYVAAANIPSRKVGAGLLLSATTAAYSLPLALLTGSSEPKEVLNILISLLCIAVFPPIGALVAKRRRRTDQPLRLLRPLVRLSAYASLPMGVFLPLAAWLTWYRWRRGPYLASEADKAGDMLLPSTLVAVASLLLVVYAVIIFVRRRGWKKGIVLNKYVYVVAIMAAALCFGFVRRDRENRPVPGLLKTIEEDELGKVDANFVFPDPANPATLYIQASQAIPDEKPMEDLSDPRPFTAREKPKLAAWLSDRADALVLVLRADDVGAMRFPRYAIEGVDWMWRDLGRLALALAARARLAAGQGDVSEALLYLRPIFHMSAALSGQAELHMFLGCHYRAIAVHVLREMLRQPQLSEQQSSLIGQEVSSWEATVLPDREHWSHTVRSKTPYVVERALSRVRTESPWSYLVSQFVSKDAILEKRARLMTACLSEPSWRSMFERFRAERRTGYAYDPLSAPLLGDSARKLEALARADLHDVEALIRVFLSQLTRIRLLRTYAAVSLYRQRHGKLPSSWSDLVPTYLPGAVMDPFAGKPLRLKGGDNGLCVYSVGADGEDGGGTGCFSVEEAERYDTEGHAYSNEWVADIAIVVLDTPTDREVRD